MATNKTKRPEITKSVRPKTQIIDVRDEYNEIKSFPITGELPLTIYVLTINADPWLFWQLLIEEVFSMRQTFI